MKTKLFILSLLVSATAMAGHINDSDRQYLRKVLSNLEKIGSASYNETREYWQPGDTVATSVRTIYVQEYNNPADTTIGACCVHFKGANGTQFDYGYDGQVKVLVYPEDKEIQLDDFTTLNLPFRLVSPPFFNYTKNIIHYALTTTDKVEVQWKDEGNHYFLRLTINEDRQVEFLGKAHFMPENPFTWDATSIYELWISKSNDLPYKKRREMSHETTVDICTDVKFNNLSLNDFDVYAYFPQDYKVTKRREIAKARATAKSKSSKHPMEGEQAPVWTLNDTDGNPVSLSDLKSKVVLINFTGIGCGPCAASIPFLKTLKECFPADVFDLIALEGWSGSARTIKYYSDKNQLNYRMLNATKEVLEQYKTGGSVPQFILLDEQRVIRMVYSGYAKGRSDEEILKAIQELL